MIRILKQLKESSQWDMRREFSKINYHIHTKAIETHIIPKHNLPVKNQGIIYASEADLLNVALFGLTASQWRKANPKAKGNVPAIRAMNQRMASDPRLTSLLVPISDGMCVGVVNYG